MPTLIDSHADTFGRIVEQGHDFFSDAPDNPLHITLPRLQRARVDVQVCVAWTPPSLEGVAAAKHAARIFDAVDDALARAPQSLLAVSDRATLDAALADPARVGLVKALEGASALCGSVEMLREFHARGLRIVTLTWNHGNELASGCGDPNPGPLTERGVEMTALMENLGVIIDVAHLSPTSLSDLLRRATKPLMCSHTGLQRFCPLPFPRTISDDQARAIAETGGVIGLDFVPGHLLPEAQHPPGGLSRRVLCRQYAALIDLVGLDAVGIGSDWDGFNDTLCDLRTLDDEPEFLAQLQDFLALDDRDFARLTGENWARLFRAWWTAPTPLAGRQPVA